MKALCLVVSDKKIFCFPYISLCKTCDPQGRPSHNLNKLGRDLLGDATYQGAMPCGFRQEDFFMCSLYKPI